MRLPIAFLALCIAHGVHCGLINSLARVPGDIAKGAGDFLNNILGGGKSQTPKPANLCSKDVLEDYEKGTSDFYNKLYTKIAARYENHFVFSPYSIWLSLAALAESADTSLQSQLFTSLDLPQEKCLRNKYYKIALNVESSGRDVTLARERILAIDNSVKVLSSWKRWVKRTGLLNYAHAPIKSDPATASEDFREFMQADFDFNIDANSLLLDSLDYHGLWTTAFDKASIIRNQPFFNELGQKVGVVDMMRIKKRVRLAYAPFMNAKVLELPVGKDGRFTMLFAICTGNNLVSNAIQVFMGSLLEIFSLLQMSLIPLDIAIPRFQLTSEFNLRPELEEIGIRAIWQDPKATIHVSNPPATPGGLFQRVSIRVGSEGVEPPPKTKPDILSGILDLATNTATGVAAAVGHEFTADKPFMFALFDTKTRTCMFAGSYSKPMSTNIEPNKNQ